MGANGSGWVGAEQDPLHSWVTLNPAWLLPEASGGGGRNHRPGPCGLRAHCGESALVAERGLSVSGWTFWVWGRGRSQQQWKP